MARRIFKVTHSEINTLAEKSTDATDDITDFIKRVKDVGVVDPASIPLKEIQTILLLGARLSEFGSALLNQRILFTEDLT